MEGRVIDIYNRVTSKASFIPFDNEVSERYLRWVFFKAKKSKKKISITRYTVMDKNYTKIIEHIAIYSINDGKAILYRQFIKSENGSICELDEGTPFTVDEYPYLKVWPGVKEEVNEQEEIKMETDIQGVHGIEMDDYSRINIKDNVYNTESERRLLPTY